MNIYSKLSRLYNRSPKKDPLEEMLTLPRYTPGECSINGSTILYADAPSFVSMYKEIFRRHLYQFECNNIFPFIIDCGANIGISAIYFKKLFPQAEIMAFEPDPIIYDYLCKNIASANLAGVTLINKGLWKEDNEIEFVEEGADAGRIFQVGEDVGAKDIKKVAVERLSKYIGKKVDFLKIDIEGAETEVIKEIDSTLHLVDRMFIEYHSLVDQKQELDVILSVLSKHRFRYHIESSFQLRERPFVDKADYLNIDCFLHIYAIKE